MQSLQDCVLFDGYCGYALGPDRASLILLVAEGTIYQASAAVLCQESSVFTAILTGQDNTYEQGTHDGRPYIRLPDTAADVLHWILAVHMPNDYYTKEESDSFAGIAAVLRLSTKYDVPHLRQRSIAKLMEHYPISLRAFDNRKTWDSGARPEDFAADILALNLARETNVPHLLPVILYDIALGTSVQEIFTGKVSTTLGFPLVPINEEADKMICLSAIPKLLSHQMASNHALLAMSYDTRCSNRDSKRCNAQKLRWLQYYGLRGVKPPSSTTNFGSPQNQRYDPLCAMGLSPLAQEGNKIGGDDYESWMCKICVKDARLASEKQRRVLWNALPEIFGLPGWNQLLKGVELQQEYEPLSQEFLLGSITGF